MTRKIFFGLLWLGLTVYAFAFPVNSAIMSSSDLDLIIKLSTGELSEINPMVTAIFYIMGIFPLVYGAFILFDDREKSVSPYPFFIGSMGLGAFALLPYLALRQPSTTWNGQKNPLEKILDAPITAMISFAAVVVFLTWGVTQGNWSDFIAQWHTSQFVHVMSIDFCCLSLLFPAILGDDMKRRGVKSGLLKAIAYIPLFGVLIYWCLRPQLSVSSQSFVS